MHQSRRRRQSGVALLVTLVLVALLALLAFSGSEATRLQQRLASNSQAAQIAFQAAEAALNQAVSVLYSHIDLSQFCNISKPYTYAINDITEWKTDTHWKEVKNIGEPVPFNGLEGKVGYAKTITPPPPRFLIGCVDPDAVEGFTPQRSMVEGKAEAAEGTYYFFRIYAQGFGPEGKISRMIEARYAFEG